MIECHVLGEGRELLCLEHCPAPERYENLPRSQLRFPPVRSKLEPFSRLSEKGKPGRERKGLSAHFPNSKFHKAFISEDDVWKSYLQISHLLFI